MTSTDPSITYLLGAGMVHDVLAWVLVVACMMTAAFALGLLLGVWRKRRIAKNARHAEIALKNWEHVVPLVPAPYNTPLADLLKQQGHTLTDSERRAQRISFAYGNVGMHNPDVTREMVEAQHDKMYGQPTAPACGIAQSCNGCNDCPDLHRAPIESLDV